MEKQVEQVIKQLNQMGFDGERHREFVAEKISHSKDHFTVVELNDMADGNSLLAEAAFTKDPDLAKYHVDGYKVHAQQPMSVPDITVNCIAVKELHDRMNRQNWGKDFKDDYLHFFDDDTEQVKGNSPVVSILKDLWRLSGDDDPVGKAMRDKLMYKFLVDTPFEKYHDLSHLRSRYTAERSYTSERMPRLDTAYKELVRDMSRSLLRERPPRRPVLTRKQSQGIKPA